MERKCAVCVYPWNSCETCCVTVGYWGVWPLEWGFSKTNEKFPQITFSSDGTGYAKQLTKEEVQKMIDETLKNGTTWKPEDFTPKIKITGLSFSQAFDIIRNDTTKGMRLPSWKPDVKIKLMIPHEGSDMTAPYIYVQSFRQGRIRRVPWRETFPELFSNEWEIVSDDSLEACIKQWREHFKDIASEMNTTSGSSTTSTSKGYPDGTTTTYTSR